jgi:SAM-dependent methyltransferase
LANDSKSQRYFGTRFTYDPGRATVWRVVGRYLQRYVRADEALLDLGAGYGEAHRALRAREKWALDVNRDVTSYWEPEVRPLVQSALAPLPFGPGAIGTVLASNFFEHFTIEDAEAILTEIARVIRPGGRLIVVQPNFRLEPRRYFDDYTHRTPFTDAGFADFVRSLGWKVVRLEPRFLPFSMKSRLPRFGWLVALYLALPFRPFAGQFLLVAEAPDSSA